MHEIFIITLWFFGIYFLGVGVAYVIAAKIIGYDNMTGTEQEEANWAIALSWFGLVVCIIIAIVYCFKLLLDFIFKIKRL